MAQTISLSADKLNQLITTISELRDEVVKLTQKLEAMEPPHGSDEWWDQSEKKALKSIREGKGIVIRNKEELDAFFDALPHPTGVQYNGQNPDM